MFVNSDFSDRLRHFNAGGVRYLVVGGCAVVRYAEPRYTQDLDLWISTDPSHARAVYPQDSIDVHLLLLPEKKGLQRRRRRYRGTNR